MKSLSIQKVVDLRARIVSDPNAPAYGENQWKMPALEWTWDVLIDLAGEKNVKPMLDMPNSGKFSIDYRKYEREMSFKEFAEMANGYTETPCYLAYLRPDDLCAGLLAQADFSQIFNSSHARDTRIWIGSKGTNSGLHTDLKDNLFVQISGRKQLWLISPEHTQYVYPESDNIVNSQVRLPLSDFSRYKKLKKSTLITHIVGAGDFVYIPKGWWHCFLSLEPSISINHWFGAPISDASYVRLILKQGPRYFARTLVDAIRYGLLNRQPKNDFFFTPPPNGARFYNWVFGRGFSAKNDPSANK
ncbi:cupin-like domain-containing protein [Variovorax humicola]|uniref:Cupin-like domain-containing protein n=1 Tax=Variovorax humicola TaxID=1769758 RepID=A0ABU8VWZ4_9BURK